MTKRIALACVLLIMAFVNTGPGAQVEDINPVPPTLVSADRLQAMIIQAEADPELDAESRDRLLALYHAALSNLQEVQDNHARADAFAEAIRAAPEQTQRIHDRLEAAGAAEAPADLPVGMDTPLDALQAQLKREQAERASAEAQRAEIERQLAYQQNRPVAIRQRLAAAREEQEVIAAALQAELAGEPGSALVQARQWRLETRYIALSTEIQALDQELISLPMRQDLLTARRAEAVANHERIDKRVEALQALVNARREAEARQARTAAERTLQATRGVDPALARLAGQNAALTEARARIVEQSDRLDTELQQAQRLAARVTANFERAQTAKAVGVPARGLGELLLEHRAELPDFELYARHAAARTRDMAAVNLARLRHLEEAERLADSTAVARPAEAAAAAANWNQLLERRRELLERQVEAESDYLERLRALQAAEARMLEVARAYDGFLEEQLFWLPVGTPTHLADLDQLPVQLHRLLAPETWSEPGRTFVNRVADSPLFWLTLLLSAVLLWKRRALIAAIQAAATPPASLSSDRFGHTLRALLWTLALAAPLPLLLGVSGWLLLGAGQGTALSLALGTYLVRVALILYVLLLLRALCLPGGVAMAHFRWNEADVRRLGRELRWLTWALVPAVLVLRVTLALNPAEAGGLVGRFALLVAGLALALFFYRILHPGHGLLAQRRRRPDAGLFYRTYPLWFPALIAFPMVIVILVWSGYIYTAHILIDAFVVTLGMLVALILLYALGLRWLRLISRRLALQAALERRRAAMAAREQESQGSEPADPAPPDDADLDIDTANQQSVKLLRISIAVVGAIAVFLIWSKVFPALGILDQVTLWHTTVMVDGEERRVPISLADLGLALIYLSGALVLARRLPAFMNLVLAARRLEFDSGSRYAIATLTAYVVVAVGILVAFNTIGAQWSQLQWLVAALGVGIGFGLQEIVANFISGLIILFERPIRVGDVVTVGDTDGVVTRIRIRATTIRNWERKELLVPNKEFITGRLLNWSLSDRVMRITVTVGVAYGTDVDQAHALMREAAEEHPVVLKEPAPILFFEAFRDNALTLVLFAFIDDLDRWFATVTELHKAIYRKFQQAGITIAFPQRDLHLDARAPLRVSVEGPEAGNTDTGMGGPPTEGR